MTHYRITCEFRLGASDSYAVPTHSETHTVSADTVQDARLLAIDATYAAHPNTCAHVRPVHVRQVPAVVSIVETLHASPEIPMHRWVITFYRAPAAVAQSIEGQRLDTSSALSFGGALAQVAQGADHLDTAGVYHVTDTRRAGRAHNYSAGAFRLRTLSTPETASEHIGEFDSLLQAHSAALDHLESADTHATPITR